MKTTRKFSGNALNLSYSFAHNLRYDPNYLQVTPLSADAAGVDGVGNRTDNYYATHDANTITITYFNPPPAGTNNLVFSIEALVITSFDGDGNPVCDQNSGC